MERSDEAWVLSVRDLGDFDRIVSLLTQHHGPVRGVAKSAKRSRKRFGGALEPLTRVQLTWQDRGKDLERLDRCEGLQSYVSVLGTPETQALAAYIVEVTERVVHPGQSEDDLFRLLGTLLEGVRAKQSLWLVRRYFEYWVLRLMGSLDPEHQCDSCQQRPKSIFVDSSGAWVCKDCANAEALPWHSQSNQIFNYFSKRALSEVPPLDQSYFVRTDLDAKLTGSLRTLIEKSLKSDAYFRLAMQVSHKGMCR